MSTVRFVVRPGETEFDGQSRIQGSLNLPLTEFGEQQVEQIIAELRLEQPFDVIYASPTEPAASTAHAIAAALGVPVRIVDGLANLHQGLWQGMQLDEIRRKHPRVYKQWEDQPESVCAPDGEECEEALERVEQSLRKPLKRDESFIVVAPEPIATLISSSLRGELARLAGPVAGCCHRSRVERIEPLPAITVLESIEPKTPLHWRGLPANQIPAVM